VNGSGSIKLDATRARFLRRRVSLYGRTVKLPAVNSIVVPTSQQAYVGSIGEQLAQRERILERTAMDRALENVRELCPATSWH
jgi:chaperone required for assembly of F1-ATPase